MRMVSQRPHVATQSAPSHRVAHRCVRTRSPARFLRFTGELSAPTARGVCACGDTARKSVPPPSLGPLGPPPQQRDSGRMELASGAGRCGERVGEMGTDTTKNEAVLGDIDVVSHQEIQRMAGVAGPCVTVLRRPRGSGPTRWAPRAGCGTGSRRPRPGWRTPVSARRRRASSWRRCTRWRTTRSSGSTRRTASPSSPPLGMPRGSGCRSRSPSRSSWGSSSASGRSFPCCPRTAGSSCWPWRRTPCGSSTPPVTASAS